MSTMSLVQTVNKQINTDLNGEFSSQKSLLVLHVSTSIVNTLSLLFQLPTRTDFAPRASWLQLLAPVVKNSLPRTVLRSSSLPNLAYLRIPAIDIVSVTFLRTYL